MKLKSQPQAQTLSQRLQQGCFQDYAVPRHIQCLGPGMRANAGMYCKNRRSMETSPYAPSIMSIVIVSTGCEALT